MSSLKSLKTLLAFVLLGVVGAWMGCSDSAPVASRPAGKATCSLCEFLGDDTYTAPDGLAAPESPDTTQTEAEADSTQTDADADSTQSATVEFADANLERCVREALNRPAGPLTPADLAALTELDASDKNIESLAGLEHATALHTLHLRSNAITDVSPLASLTNLHTLSLWGNKVADVSPLAGLINLQKLSLWGNEITDVSPLARLTNLQWLQLGDNEIADVSPLASLTNLQWLGVMENALTQHAANQQLAAAIARGLRVQSHLGEETAVETDQTDQTAPQDPSPTPSVLPTHLYWTDAGADQILRANLAGTLVIDTLVSTGSNSNPYGLALDLENRKMYWTDYRRDTIEWADLDGENRRVILNRRGNDPTGNDPKGLALDLVRRKMYWVEDATNLILRANLDGSDIEVLYRWLNNPAFIALDWISGKMYWTERGTDRIQRANLDGRHVRTLIRLPNPTGIALDLAGGKMYWTDSDWQVDGTDRIQRANLDGTQRRNLTNADMRLAVPTGIALDLARGKMYYADTFRDTIRRANLDGSNVEAFIEERPFVGALELGTE